MNQQGYIIEIVDNITAKLKLKKQFVQHAAKYSQDTMKL